MADMSFKNKNNDLYSFHAGTNYRAYDYMGAHPNGNGDLCFRVWAPNAEGVYLVGDFNQWSDSTPMRKMSRDGIWETVLVGNAAVGSLYKYKIITQEGKALYRADPYARVLPPYPETASVVDLDNSFEWHDEGWLRFRKSNMTGSDALSAPINIYQLHMGAWKRNGKDPYSYAELARELAPYVKQMGYTHVSVLPVGCVGDLGYAVSSYYAPSSVLGSSTDFKEFVDLMHSAGVGVIITFVPLQYSSDEQGLASFDGGDIYEDIGRNEVQSFYVSGALYWLKEYHIDGIAVDFPSQPDPKDAWRAFFKKLSRAVSLETPDSLLMVYNGGAYKGIVGNNKKSYGFIMDLNKEANDNLYSYVATDPILRKFHHIDLTDAVDSRDNGRSLISLTHKDVPLIERSFGSYSEKFAGARAFMGLMMTSPKKKMTFMGNEIAQFRAFDPSKETEWFLLGYEKHSLFQRYVAELNAFYLENRALWENDGSEMGFEWIDKSNSGESMIAYKRVDKEQNELYVIINFTPVMRKGYTFCRDKRITLVEALNSDSIKYGGSGLANKGEIKSVFSASSRRFEISLNVPPLSVIILKNNLYKKQ